MPATSSPAAAKRPAPRVAGKRRGHATAESHPRAPVLFLVLHGGSVDGYYAFMLIATAFVLMMTVPALALFYGGMSRSKSVLNMMMMSLRRGGDRRHPLRRRRLVDGLRRRGHVLRRPVRPVLARRRHHRRLHLRDVPDDVRDHHRRADQRRGRRPDEVLRLGGLRARSGRCSSTSRWRTWSSAAPRTRSSAAGSAPRTTPVARRSTSTPVSPRLVLVVLLGKRIGFGKEAIRPHNLTLTMLGAGLLWMGWYGFNVGSIVFAGATDGSTAVPRRDRPHLRQHHAGHDGRDPRLAARSSTSCTRRPPRSAPRPASSRAWSRSPRRPARSTSRARSPSAPSPVRSAPGPSG